MAIVVRPMEQGDIGEAADIHKRILKEGLTRSIGYSVEDLFKAFVHHSPKTCLVANDGDRVVGFIVGDVKEWSFGVEKTGWLEIVGVDPDFMGRGIGKALGEALLQRFHDEGIREVYTSVRWDSGDLIEFFKSIGFDKSGFINLEYKYS